MKKLSIFLLPMFFLFACKRETIHPVDEIIPGGRGGNFNIAVFPLSVSTGVHGTVYIKYGSKTVPSDYKAFSDSMATMVEPGFGPHAHFFNLKPGFYAIAAQCSFNNKVLKGDTLIEITSSQNPSVDYLLQIK